MTKEQHTEPKYRIDATLTTTANTVTREILSAHIFLICWKNAPGGITQDNLPIFNTTIVDKKNIFKEREKVIEEKYPVEFTDRIGAKTLEAKCSLYAAEVISDKLKKEIMPLIDKASEARAKAMLKDLKKTVTTKILTSGRIKGATVASFYKLLDQRIKELKSEWEAPTLASEIKCNTAVIHRDVIRAHYLIGVESLDPYYLTEQVKEYANEKAAVIFAGQEMSGLAVAMLCKISVLLKEAMDDYSKNPEYDKGKWYYYKPPTNGKPPYLLVEAQKFTKFILLTDERNSIRHIRSAANELHTKPINKAFIAQKGKASVKIHTSSIALPDVAYLEATTKKDENGKVKKHAAMLAFGINPNVLQIKGVSEDVDYISVCTEISDAIYKNAQTLQEADKAIKTAVLLAAECDSRDINAAELSELDKKIGRASFAKYTYTPDNDRTRQKTITGGSDTRGDVLELVKIGLNAAGINLETDRNGILLLTKQK